MKSFSRSSLLLLLFAGALMICRPRGGTPCTTCSVAAGQIAREAERTAAAPASLEKSVAVESTPEAGGLVRRQDLWKRPVSEPAFAEFKDWTARYVAAGPAERVTLEAEGARLARVRQRAMADMIASRPERALELTVPHGVRRGLPGSVTGLLEVPVNTQGEYRVLAARPVEGGGDAITPVTREAVVNGVRHAVYTYGAAQNYVSKSRVPLNGIALPASAGTNPPAGINGAPDSLMALDPNPARALDDDEVQDYLTASATEPVCPESGDEVTANSTPGVVEIGGDLHAFCGSVHAQLWAASAVEGAGLNIPDGAAAAAGGVVAASGYTEGGKRFLFLRVKFTDSSGAEGDTIPQSTAESLLAGMVTHMADLSYDRLKIAPLGDTGSAITTPLALNHPASYYNDAGLSKLYPDARAAAATAGYTLDNYQFFAVFTKNRPSAGYAGLAYVGGIGIHIANGYWGRNVLTHELGHNLGLPHAHTWDTGTNSIIGDGTNVEYGNNYDPIGSGGDSDHYVGSYKRYLDWIPGANGDPVTTPGIYRLHAMDDMNGNQGLRTLRVSRNGSQDYSFDFRGDRGEEQFQKGLFAHFCNKDGRESYLLDCTPRQNNIAQPIGRTFTDPTAGVYVTPLRRANTSPASMDVAVYFNTAGNRPPRAVVTCHSPKVPAGSEVLFTAEATDPDGNELAYSWDFGDGTYSMDNAARQTHTFAADGEYPVQCTVSDLRGGTWRRTVPVQVGAPVAGQYHITGRVLDAGGKPLSGIRVYTDDAHYCWTDTDGSYFLARVPAGSVTVKIREMVENKLAFSPVFTNPLTLAGHYSGADFAISATPPEILTPLVAKLSTWKYHDQGVDLGTAWRGPYNDASWPSGPGMLGYGNGGEGTVVSYGGDANNKRTTCYFRKSFTVANPAAFEDLRLECKRDDMVIVYLNGTRIFADNLPDNVTVDTVTYSTKARDSVEPNDYLVQSGITPSLLVAGTNILSAEVHQVEPTSSDLAFDAALTGIATAPGTGAAAAYLSSPVDGATLYTPLTSVTLVAEARASAATVTKVEFYSDNVKLGEDTVAPYQWAWSNPAAGTHALHTVTTFNAGLPLTSGTVTVNLTAPPVDLIAPGSAWKYHASKTTAPPANWYSPAYTDTWPAANAQLGYGDGDEAGTISGGPYNSVYFRRFFDVSDPAAITGLLARMIRDDAANVYVNGTLVWRSNFSQSGTDWTPLGAGADAIENAWHTQPLDAALLHPGSNLVAVEVQQNSPTSSDLSFDFALAATGTTVRAAGVYLTAPAAVTLPAPVLLQADAVVPAGRGVTKVEFFHNGTKIGEDTTWPYEFTWSGAGAGANTLTARVTDSTGATEDSATRSVQVSQPAQGTALVSFGENWKYIDTGIDPGANWVGRTSYDDTAWPSGNGRLGYGGDGEVTTIARGTPSARPITAWFRKKFTVTNPAAFSALRLRVLRDDGVSVQLNRTELVRDNLPEGLLTFSSLATEGISGAAEQTPVEFIVPVTALLAGENQLAVEVHQNAASSSDLGFDLALYGLTSPTGTFPAVWLTSPASGERLNPASSVALAAAFAGAPAVQRVEYCAGAAKIGEAVAAPWSFTWTAPLNGSYTLKARAILTGGGSLDSTAIPVTIVAPDQSVILVAAGADWKYLDTGVAPATGWQNLGFNDTAWLSGPARLGFGGDGETTVMTSGRLVYWARRTYTVPAGTTPVSATMRVQRDDGLAIYIDGIRAAKININDEPVRNDSAAVTAISGDGEQEWLTVTVPATALTPGTHQVAVSIHQNAVTSSDTGFDMAFDAVLRPVAGVYNTQPVSTPPLRLAARAGTGDSLLDLTLTDQAGRVYVVEKSLDLRAWQPVSTHILTGPTLTVPLTRGTDPRAYYRARWTQAP